MENCKALKPSGGYSKFEFWNNHRSFWNKFNVKDDNDRAALLKYFYKFHFEFFNAIPDITECFTVIFVEQPNKTLLHWCENKWIKYLNAKIIKLILIEFLCLVIVIELPVYLFTFVQTTHTVRKLQQFC